MRIVCVGDSMTDRTNSTERKARPYVEPDKEDRPLAYYPKHLADISAADVWPYSTFSELHGDEPIMPIIKGWAIEAVRAVGADIGVVQGGGDDLDPKEDRNPLATVEETLAHFEACHEAIVKAGAKCLFLLIPYEHKQSNDEGGRNRRRLNHRLWNLYSDNTLHYYHLLYGHPDLLDPGDKFHPSDMGCAVMAALIAEKIKGIR